MSTYFYEKDLSKCYIRVSKFNYNIADFFGVIIDVFESKEFDIKLFFVCSDISKSKIKEVEEDIKTPKYKELIKEKESLILSKIIKKDYSNEITSNFKKFLNKNGEIKIQAIM